MSLGHLGEEYHLLSLHSHVTSLWLRLYRGQLIPNDLNVSTQSQEGRTGHLCKGVCKDAHTDARAFASRTDNGMSVQGARKN